MREAIHLVVEGVASVEDVDKAVTAGAGLGWAVLGPHMLFSLASGDQGMEVFCERYRDSFETWWKFLGSPVLDATSGRLLSIGAAEQSGRGFEEVAGQRDGKIIRVLEARAFEVY